MWEDSGGGIPRGAWGVSGTSDHLGMPLRPERPTKTYRHSGHNWLPFRGAMVGRNHYGCMNLAFPGFPKPGDVHTAT